MQYNYQVKTKEAGFSVEKILRQSLGFSRSMVRKLKNTNGVLVNGQASHLNRPVQEGDLLSIDLHTGKATPVLPQPIPLDIVYEDKHLLAVNKPYHMLVHPLKKEPLNTLANAVLYHYLQNGIEPVYRPVSRLDRDTSGLVVVAKHAHAGHLLTTQLGEGKLVREYLAVVHGLLANTRSTIDQPLARCPLSYIRQTVQPGGKRAVTHYQVEKHLADSTLVKLRLETGRTHQIRAHMSHIGHPLLGDTLYGGREEGINRQALHCWRISMLHPLTNKPLVLQASLPVDMQKLLQLSTAPET